MKKLAIIDAGHGGVNRIGQYTTAPAKMHKHDKGEFHMGTNFYEGVFNRQLALKVQNTLRDLQVPFITVYHTYEDISLRDRVAKANYWSRGMDRVCGVSIHANASPLHNARGSEVYTSPGDTDSDLVADLYFAYLEQFLVGRETLSFTLRRDLTDGDPDKEAKFYMLTQTRAPFILLETLFFDQYDDARLLMQGEVQDLFADATAYAIKTYLEGS